MERALRRVRREARRAVAAPAAPTPPPAAAALLAAAAATRARLTLFLAVSAVSAAGEPSAPPETASLGALSPPNVSPRPTVFSPGRTSRFFLLFFFPPSPFARLADDLPSSASASRPRRRAGRRLGRFIVRVLGVPERGPGHGRRARHGCRRRGRAGHAPCGLARLRSLRRGGRIRRRRGAPSASLRAFSSLAPPPGGLAGGGAFGWLASLAPRNREDHACTGRDGAGSAGCATVTVRWTFAARVRLSSDAVER